MTVHVPAGSTQDSRGSCFSQASILLSLHSRAAQSESGDTDLVFGNQTSSSDCSRLSDLKQINLLVPWFFHCANSNLKISVVAETAAIHPNPFLPSPQYKIRQLWASLEAAVVLWLNSCQQNVSTSDICNLRLLVQGPLLPGWNGEDQSSLKNGVVKGGRAALSLGPWMTVWNRVAPDLQPSARTVM